MSAHSEYIGQQIKAARKALKISQTHLGEMIGKTLRTIQKYESGEIEPSLGMINTLAACLQTTPTKLIGYESQPIRLDSLADVFSVILELEKKAGLRFEINIEKPPQDKSWRCSLQFDGSSVENPFNADLCSFLERFAEERENLETYMIERTHYDHWIETELAYYANTTLDDRPIEYLSPEERIRRRDRRLTELYSHISDGDPDAKKNGD